MKKLSILRHAKSDHSDMSVRDFDRPINERGILGAKLMGEHLAEKSVKWDEVLSSPALRCVETIEHFEQGYGQSLNPKWDKRIYLASSVTLMDVLRDTASPANHILMIGHNPGLEDLIFDLVPQKGKNPLREIVEEKFPTATFATMSLTVDSWEDIENSCATLDMLVRPRDLNPDLGPQMD